MTDRRIRILDGALQVLAEHGMRGLTHRAVDAAAGIAPGSTSYYFRTRSALVAGCTQRLLEIDLEVRAPPVDAGVEGLLDALTAGGVALVTVGRDHTLARYELSLAAVRDPVLRAEMTTAGDAIRAVLAAAIGALGLPDPAGTATEVAAVLDGLAFTALVRGPADPAALAAWMRPVLEAALARTSVVQRPASQRSS